MEPDALQRAYRILDTLLRELQLLGHTVAIRPPADRWGVGVTFVRLQGQDIAFHLAQVGRLVRLERPSTGDAWWYPKVRVEPTRDLRFMIDTWTGGARASWRDGKRQRLELVIDDIIAGLVAAAAFQDERDRIRAAEAFVQAEAEARRREAALAQQHEEARARYFAQQVAAWRFHEEAGRFLAGLKGRMEEEQNKAARQVLQRWTAWAEHHVQSGNPLVDLRIDDLDGLTASLPPSFGPAI